jgi:hypothetical protein
VTGIFPDHIHRNRCGDTQYPEGGVDVLFVHGVGVSVNVIFSGFPCNTGGIQQGRTTAGINEKSNDPGKFFYQKLGKNEQTPCPVALENYPPDFSTKCAY